MGTTAGQPQTAALPGVRRLGIPVLHLAEGQLGSTRQPSAAMTAPLGLAATFSRADAYANGVVLGRDARALRQQGVARPFGAIDTGGTGAAAAASYGENPLLAAVPRRPRSPASRHRAPWRWLTAIPAASAAPEWSRVPRRCTRSTSSRSRTRCAPAWRACSAHPPPRHRHHGRHCGRHRGGTRAAVQAPALRGYRGPRHHGHRRGRGPGRYRRGRDQSPRPADGDGSGRHAAADGAANTPDSSATGPAGSAGSAGSATGLAGSGTGPAGSPGSATGPGCRFGHRSRWLGRYWHRAGRDGKAQARAGTTRAGAAQGAGSSGAAPSGRARKPAGQAPCGNPGLLIQDLRSELGFTGFVLAGPGANPGTLSLDSGLDGEVPAGGRAPTGTSPRPRSVPRSRPGPSAWPRSTRRPPHILTKWTGSACSTRHPSTRSPRRAGRRR